MIVDIPAKDGDDKRFITALNGLIAIIVNIYEPGDVYVIRINKWFDHKWLKYSGKGIVQFPEKGVDLPRTGHSIIERSLDEFFQKKLTFPPFNPKQVGMQLHWKRHDDGSYGGSDKPKWLHSVEKRVLQHSSKNLQNRLSSFTKSGVFIWFSSNTVQNMHGSLLVYSILNNEEGAWYASFKKDNGWKVNHVKGINKETVQQWFPLG